ncbi:MAG: cytosine permease [Thermoleophilia bacterium]
MTGEEAERSAGGIERYGVEAVPAELRTTRWRDLATILFTFNLSPLTYVLGGVAATAGGLPLWWAAGALGLGSLIGVAMITLPARVGVEHGLPGQVAMRATFGLLGSRALTSPYRVAASSYWFAAQALVCAGAAVALIRSLADVDLPLIPISLGTAAVAAVLAAIGFDALRYFVRIVLPLTLLSTGVLISIFVASDDERLDPSRVLDSPGQSFTWAAFAAFVTVMWGAQLTTVTNAADFCRYVRTRRDMEVGFVVGATLGTFVAAWVGAYAGIALERTNPFEVAGDLTGNPVLLVALLVAVLAQTTSANVINLYTAGLSLVNAVPALGRLRATLAVCVLGIGLSAWEGFVDQAQDFFTHLGNVAAPITGVVLADYVLLKRTRLDLPALFEPEGRYRFVAGVNPAAVVAVAVGVAVYYAVPDAALKAAVGVAVSALVYLACARGQALLVPRLGDAIRPAGRLPAGSGRAR